MTFSKYSPVSSSRPGSKAMINDFIIGRKPCCSGRKCVSYRFSREGCRGYVQEQQEGIVWGDLTLTDVAAYWKNGNNPADQSGRSRCNPSD